MMSHSAEGQESGSRLAVWFCLRGYQSQAVSQGWVSECLTELKEGFSSKLTRRAVGWQLQCRSNWMSPCSQHGSPRACGGGERHTNHTALYDLVSKSHTIIYTLFYSLEMSLALAHIYGMGPAEGMNTRRQGSLGTILEFGYHNLQSKIGELLDCAILCYVLLPVNFRKGNCVQKLYYRNPSYSNGGWN